MITFTVYGKPLPKGSAKAFVLKGTNRAIVTSDTKGLKGWEAAVRVAAQRVASGQLLQGPLEIAIDFYLPSPQSKPKARTYPTTRPDLDKLVRGCTDPLTGVLWHDDSQIVMILARKFYATGDDAPCAHFAIGPRK